MEELITALAPAFASGLALQRLIEILDPLINLLLGAEYKRIVLGLVSLILGCALAFGIDLHILGPLGVTLTPSLNFLDHLLVGLIISAGTEGFNSLLKFLSYKKEEQKAETLGEALNVNTAFLGRRRELEDFMVKNTSLTLTTPEGVLKEALQEQVRNVKNDQTLILDFKNGKFNQHVVSDQQAQVITLRATAEAAKQFQSILNDKGKQIVRNSITFNTGYGAAVGVMLDAIAKGTDPMTVIT